MSKLGVKVMDHTSHEYVLLRSVPFPPANDYSPCAVARSALLRYKNCPSSFIGHARSFNLAMPMDEIAEPEKDHLDILDRWDVQTLKKGNKKAFKKAFKHVAIYHPSPVAESDYDDNTWARDRLHWLVRHVSTRTFQECYNSSVSRDSSRILTPDFRIPTLDQHCPEEWSVDYPELGEPYEYAPRLVCSEAPGLRGHEPLWQLNGQIQEHLKYFSIEPLRVEDLAAERWERYT